MNNRKQKWTALGVAGALLLPLAGITGFASDAADVRTLQKALIQKDALAQGQDLNEDGAVNGFDLVRLRRQVLEASQSGEIRETDVAITEQTAKLVGRTLRKGDTTWLVQSGAAAEFTVTGTSAELTLAGDGCAAGDEKYRPRYAVYVDGEQLCDSLMSETETKLQLFSSDTVHQATVKVIHLSEANNGAIGVRNLHVAAPDSLASPCAPTAKKPLSIEFIGDSITCGYGNICSNESPDFVTREENASLTYMALLAGALDAEFSCVAASGNGIAHDYGGNTVNLIPELYPCTDKLLDGHYGREPERWDMAADPVDLVVIKLGANDQPTCAGAYLPEEERTPEALAALRALFTDRLYAFLDEVFALRGDVPVLYLYEQDMALHDEIAGTLARYAADHPGRRLYGQEIHSKYPHEGVGANGHWSSVTHARVARELCAKVRELLC